MKSFDHEKLDVYQVSLKFCAWAYEISQTLTGANRHARDQLLRASQSIPQNIAEGNGKRSLPDRKRFFEIARGSALECTATLDILLTCNAIEDRICSAGKDLLHRIVSMLSRMTERASEIREDIEPFGSDVDYDYEHEHRPASGTEHE